MYEYEIHTKKDFRDDKFYILYGKKSARGKLIELNTSSSLDDLIKRAAVSAGDVFVNIKFKDLV